MSYWAGQALPEHLSRYVRTAAFPGWMPGTAVAFGARLATVLAAGSYAYAGFWPESQIFGRCVVASNRPTEIALTYDDGPGEIDTMHLLDVLAQHNVRATFFMIGDFVRQFPNIARSVAAAGHLIGNHTMNHPLLLTRSRKVVRQQLRDCNAAIEDVLGIRVQWFRPPHGSRRPDILRFARELGMRTVMWNSMGYDWKDITADAIEHNVLRGFRRNQRRRHATNVLLHDSGQAQGPQDRSRTVEATSRLIPFWKHYFDQREEICSFVTPEAWV